MILFVKIIENSLIFVNLGMSKWSTCKLIYIFLRLFRKAIGEYSFHTFKNYFLEYYKSKTIIISKLHNNSSIIYHILVSRNSNDLLIMEIV